MDKRLLKKVAEKRRYIRLDVADKIRLIPKPEIGLQPKTAAALSKNISIEGICFKTAAELKSGEGLSIEMYLSQDPNPVHLRGEVIWCKPLGHGKRPQYEAGVKLLTIDKTDENRFIIYACDRMVEYLSGQRRV